MRYGGLNMPLLSQVGGRLDSGTGLHATKSNFVTELAWVCPILASQDILLNPSATMHYVVGSSESKKGRRLILEDFYLPATP
jgi:hypothetical protein